LRGAPRHPPVLLISTSVPVIFYDQRYSSIRAFSY